MDSTDTAGSIYFNRRVDVGRQHKESSYLACPCNFVSVGRTNTSIDENSVSFHTVFIAF